MDYKQNGSNLHKGTVSSMRAEFDNKNARVSGTRSPSGPVRELKNLGKEMGGGDEGTFNFQVSIIFTLIYIEWGSN
jgi:hypothetical protein